MCPVLRHDRETFFKNDDCKFTQSHKKKSRQRNADELCMYIKFGRKNLGTRKFGTNETK
jgi:hypothetical protein